MTAPFLSDTPDFISRGHGQKVAARATHPEFTGAIELDVRSGNIEWDEGSAPRVSARLTCRVPDDQATLDQLDPRTGVRVDIDAGYVRPGGIEDVYTIADLGLRDRRINRPDDTMTLFLQSDEALVIDGSPSFEQTVTGTYAPDAMIKIIKQIIVPYPTIDNRVAMPTSPTAISVDPLTDRWATIDDLADQMDLDVYDEGLRDWVIDERPQVVGTSNLSLKVGGNGTIITSDTGLSRDPWYNYVALRYVWKDSSDVEHTVKTTAYISTGTYATTGPAGRKIYFEEREIPTTQAQANAASAALLKRFLSKGRSMSLRAIAAYWLRPGMTITVQLPEGPQERHLVSRVDFDLEAGTMDIDTRVPLDETGTISTTTPTSTPAPDPVPSPATKYVSTWEANNSAMYKGDGTKRTNDPDLVQGYNSAYGNGRAIAIFTSANSDGGEDNVSITTALSGATISKVEAYLYADHWYSYSGGTARLGYYNGTTIPTTFSGGSPYISSPDWPRDKGRWVNITSSSIKSALLAGTCRGITIGPGSGTNLEYYGRFESHTMTYKPKLRITYSK